MALDRGNVTLRFPIQDPTPQWIDTWYFLASNVQHTKTVPTQNTSKFLGVYFHWTNPFGISKVLAYFHLKAYPTIKITKILSSNSPFSYLFTLWWLTSIFEVVNTLQKTRPFQINITPKSKQTFGPDVTFGSSHPSTKGSKVQVYGLRICVARSQVLFQQRVIELPSRLIGTILSHRIHVWYIYPHLPYFTTKNNQM